MNDKKIVNFINERNERGLELLINTYGGLITSIVKKHLYNLYDKQEECIDDVLLAIWNNINSFDSSKNVFKNWIAAISQYRAIDYKRKYLKLIKEEELDINYIETRTSIDKGIMEEEIRNEIEELLLYLKKEDREIFIKRYMEEKSIEELVLETGMKEEVIYNRLSRGRKKIRQKYDDLTIN